MKMNNKQLIIDEMLVHRLVAIQFPQWKDLPIKPIAGGHDNRTFRLGECMLVRMPSAAEYAVKVEEEHRWLPRLAPLLPLQIPAPLAMGKPAERYPWRWSIYRWIEGDDAAHAFIADLSNFATGLAHFLIALQRINTMDGPLPGPRNFYRGGALAIYDVETRQAIAALQGKIDVDTATELWVTALDTVWQSSPVWVHGDMSAGNLVVTEGQLSAVIDFGGLAIGDPACDLAMAWTFFHGKSREVFRSMLPLDIDTWARGRAWTLWKALITAAGFTHPNNIESAQCWRIIDEVITDYKATR